MDNETVGEIIIRCPAKTTYSYYNNPEEEEMCIRDSHISVPGILHR